MKMKLEDTLNAALRDTVSGFTGTGTGYAVYSTGCEQVCLTPKVDKDGKRQESEWFDIERVETVSDSLAKVGTSPSGGPRHRSEAPPTR